MVLSTALVTCMSVSVGQAQTMAQAEGATEQQAPIREYDFDIKAGPLSAVLNRFADITDMQLVYSAEIVQGQSSSGLAGRFSAPQALYAILSEGGFVFEIRGPGMVIINQLSAGDDDAVMLSPTIAMAERPTGVVIDRSNTGRAVIGHEALGALDLGAGDPMDAFDQLPNVAFSEGRFTTSEDNLQSLLPEEVSISGGDIYSNLVTFDGLQTKNYAYDISSDVPAHYDKLGVSTTHMVFLNSGLLEQVAVQDSNISAKYTGFSGGVIEFETRDPGTGFGGSLAGKYSADWLTSYLEGDEEEVGEIDEGTPQNEKYTLSGVIDIPITDKLYSMFGVGYKKSTVQRQISEAYSAYKGATVGTSDETMQFLAKLMHNISDNDTVVLSANITPFNSEFTRSNTYGDDQVAKSLSYMNFVEWRREAGGFSANIKAYFSNSGFKREAPDGFAYYYNQSYDGFYGEPNAATDVCDNERCSVGGFGDIETNQKSYGLVSDFSQKTDFGDLNFGLKWESYKLRSERFNQSSSYSFSYLFQDDDTNIVCADANDPYCIEGAQAIMRRATYPAYDIRVDLNTFDAYAELDGEKALQGFLQNIRYRFGLSATYEDFLENFQLAPRFTIGVDFADHWSLDVGANRYYERDLLTYALQNEKPLFIHENRDYIQDGNDYIVGNDWYLYREFGTTTGYGLSDLETPYTDELTAAVTYFDPDGLGTLRLKGIYRDEKEQISRITTLEETTYFLNGDYRTVDRRIFRAANDGYSTYRGLSLEWNKSFENHFLSLTATWSKTTTSNTDYFTDTEDQYEPLVYIEDPIQAENAETLDDQVIADAIITKDELKIRRAEFSVPWKFTAYWSAKWLEGKLRTSIDATYSPKYTTIEDTGVNRNYDGNRYDVYSVVDRKNRLRANLYAGYVIEFGNDNAVMLTLRANNLFNSRTHTATIGAPYEIGRNFVFGFESTF
ncbi:hypothetical protein [Emcibacter sp.]|uniref:TonB-dependent receptor n=1 Tax=Emcibacter sp. TaxID=1979954 RepID=UPI003A95D725